VSVAAEKLIFSEKPISPILEMGAYEHLWLQPKASFKRIAEMFRAKKGALPTDFVDEKIAIDTVAEVVSIINESQIGTFGIRVHGASQYPEKLRHAIDPVELLYFQGAWELTESPKAIAVVGSRKPSAEGIRRAEKLVRELLSHGYTIVSGLAEGIDTVAHKTAIAEGGNTIAVIGTPITNYYPKQNISLQKYIASKHLLISQVPILRYRQQNPSTNRFFFPERNKTMSALTQATVIVEAGETSGTLVQARAAIQQGRKLFILDSCFKNPNITWPAKYEKKGAFRVTDIQDIKWIMDGS
jgi:DNA processing protein